jgi:dTDP-4-dehydrorhamnose 3,5-epimerase-like enzyme
LNKISKKVKITKLNSINSLSTCPPPESGRLSGEKGNVLLLNNGRKIKYLSILETNEGYLRGNHYHRKKVENVFVLAGRVRGEFWIEGCPEEKLVKVLEEGDLITVRPGCAHSLISIEKSIMVEFSPQAFDPTDQLTA